MWYHWDSLNIRGAWIIHLFKSCIFNTLQAMLIFLIQNDTFHTQYNIVLLVYDESC